MLEICFSFLNEHYHRRGYQKVEKGKCNTCWDARHTHMGHQTYSYGVHTQSLKPHKNVQHQKSYYNLAQLG